MSRVSVFGLGYVGAVSAACLADRGHSVVGVDINEDKVNLLNQGVAPIVEAGMPELVHKGVAGGRLRATMDVRDAVQGTAISLICVGTPCQVNGSLDLAHVRAVCGQIGAALREKKEFHVVVARSTILPGSTRHAVIATLEESSGKKAGRDFGVCYNPEFLRESTAIADFLDPPKTVIGETEPRSGAAVVGLYEGLKAPLIRTDIETAEMVKYVDNTWHAAKICFANEIGNLCKALGLDGHRVMDIFCLDTKLNVSACYLKPGFAFGGSCLPKDVRALTYEGRHLDLDLPLLNSILLSNRQQIERGLDLILRLGSKKVGMLGFSFKAGTDDLRESPMVEVVERLLGKGYDIKIYDRSVSLARLVGSNRDYLLRRIPHIYRLIVDSADDVLDHAETIVIGNQSPEFQNVCTRLRPGQRVIDLVRIGNQTSPPGQYQGICW